MRPWASTLIVISLAGVVQAARQQGVFRIDDNGVISMAGLSFSIIHFDDQWASVNQRSDFKAAPGFPKRSGDACELEGMLAARSGNLFLRQLVKTTSNVASYEATLSSAQPVKTNTLALAASLAIDDYANQTLRIDGQPLKLPEKFAQQGILSRSGVRKLEIPSRDGSGLLTIDGPLSLHVQDDRQFNSENYALRINFDPANGAIRKSTLKLAMTYAQTGPPIDRSYTIKEGPDWRPIEQKLDVQPGSILDFSYLLDAPAGKSGPIVVKGPHFEFVNRPGQRVRFYGANLCFGASFPTKEQAEKLADRLSRLGYNSVRIHHYDAELADRNAASSATLNPAQLDRLDYFVYCLKQKGIYINIDLYTIRQVKASELPEINKPLYLDAFKGAVPVLPSAMANWKAFAKNLLTHRNPYTKLTWAEDPVLVGICPLNEDPLANVWSRDPDIKKIYEAKFEQWLKDNKIEPKDATARSLIFTRFLAETQIKANGETFAFLKSIGVTAPLTSVNCIDSIALAPVRAKEEYVDNHAYWDHPGFPERQWALPHSYGNKSALASGARVPRTMMPTRIAGKPFTCTEINYCFPNQFRAEGGPLLGAYAALQDWDGIWRFAYSHTNANLFDVRAGSGFDLVTQPLDLMSERIAILMFLRGDVRPSDNLATYVVTDANAYAAPAGWGRGYFPEAFGMLGLRQRIASSFEPNATASTEADAVKLAEAAGIDLKRRRAVSDTGQLTISSDEGTFRAVTDRSECFILSDSRQLTGRAVTVSGKGGFCVISVSSMDGKPLADSKRLLVIHLTDQQNQNQRYRAKSMTLMESWGTLPHLVRAGKATIRMELEGPGEPKAFAIDLSGARGQPVALRRDGDAWTHDADTARPAGACLAYEIVR